MNPRIVRVAVPCSCLGSRKDGWKDGKGNSGVTGAVTTIWLQYNETLVDPESSMATAPPELVSIEHTSRIQYLTTALATLLGQNSNIECFSDTAVGAEKLA